MVLKMKYVILVLLCLFSNTTQVFAQSKNKIDIGKEVLTVYDNVGKVIAIYGDQVEIQYDDFSTYKFKKNQLAVSVSEYAVNDSLKFSVNESVVNDNGFKGKIYKLFSNGRLIMQFEDLSFAHKSLKISQISKLKTEEN